MRLTRARVGATCALLLISVATERASARQVRDPAAIALDGRIVFESHPGMADLEHGVPVDPETRFGIASVTKMVTAVALLQQVEAGAMALDDPVRRHVPDFPAREGGPITLETLATHRSGLPHPSERPPALFATHYETATEAMEVYRDVDLAHAPHRARRYSFYHPWTYAESETLYRVPTWDYSFNPGGGNLTSTVRDLVAFGSALIDGRLLTPGSMERLADPAWFGRTAESGEVYLFMSGANPGLQAGFAVYPERGATAAVLSNTWGLGSRSSEMVNLATALVEACVGAP